MAKLSKDAAKRKAVRDKKAPIITSIVLNIVKIVDVLINITKV